MKRLLSTNPPARGITGGSGQKRERMANPSEEPMRGVRSEFHKKASPRAHAPVSIRLKCSSNLEIVIGILSSQSGFLSRRSWKKFHRASFEIVHCSRNLNGAAGFKTDEDGTLLPNISDGHTDIRPSDSVHEIVIFSGPFTRVRRGLHGWLDLGEKSSQVS